MSTTSNPNLVRVDLNVCAFESSLALMRVCSGVFRAQGHRRLLPCCSCWFDHLPGAVAVIHPAALPPSLPSGPSHKRCIHTLRIPVQIIQGFECLEFQQTVLCRNKHPISNSSTMYRSFANTGRWLQSSNQHPPRRLFIVVVKCHGFRFGEAEKERTRGFLENERRLWHVLH